ncbi:MAG: gliding motility-associated C-terminal domain-containing protein [Fulvivirga sp.]|nr:gliding motility-associated C-terminal domain-containing protein [Fulvivirga sp.]
MVNTTLKIKLFLLAICFLSIGAFQKAGATHLRAGEIIVERVNCQGLTFRITVVAFTDCEIDNPVLFGEGILDFGDGSDPIELPRIQNTDRSDLGEGVCTASFTTTHTYASPGIYKIGYVEPNRNEGILNIDNSIETTFYVETEINIDPFLGCNNSPVLLIPPVDRACPGVAFFHNPGAFDPDGDSLSFEIVVPKKEAGVFVDGYEPVNDPIFYEDFNQGSEDGGQPVFKIDPVTGLITWDAPGRAGVTEFTNGEYNIAFIVKEWRKIDGVYREMGFVTRDMQIIVEDCDNERPELQIPEDICVEAGTLIEETIFGTDPDNHDVKIEAFSQVFQFGATVSPDDGSFQPSVPPAQLDFTWQTECLDVRDQPYQVVFKITDNPPDGPRLVDFATWNITVVGPSPDVTDLSQEGQGLRLNWNEYVCQNAETIQVWRRVDTNPFTPDECETGMRENAGYTLINQLPVTATTFRDDDLAAAAKYCYRLVAIFPDPTGGESIVSDEICFEFIPAEEPVITHVSVENTDETNGEVILVWREPFELGTLSPPFTFRVYRAEGLTGNNFTQIAELDPASSADSVFADSVFTSFIYRDTGINTLDKAYNYQVAIVDPSGTGGGEEIFSASASTVRLEPTPQFNQIQLNWGANVPWSNTIPSPPGSEHVIYRGLEGDTDEELEFLAKVDVTQFGFQFTDSTNLVDDQVYCYKILTKGTYGNPAIQGNELRPLFNFSQMVCSQVSDTIPPCPPIVSISGPGCEERPQDFCAGRNRVFSNTIQWSTSFVGECQNDIKEYQLFFANSVGDEFELLAVVSDTFFIHKKENSFKGCYKVRAIDRSLNEGEFSETFCVDNCPNYVLPNLLTPNGDGCNDTFRAFGAPDPTITCPVAEGAPENDPALCARFVKSVEFTVYNRWGQPIFTHTGIDGAENQSIYINWDGKSDDGSEVPSGVYYYLAEVEFDVVDPAQAKKDIKGWIHVVR